MLLNLPRRPQREAEKVAALPAALDSYKASIAIRDRLVGVVLGGQDNNILTQVGFVVLIGLAAKNAILIVAPSSPSRWKSAARIDGATMIDLTGPPAEPTAQKAKRIAPPPWRSPLPYRKR